MKVVKVVKVVKVKLDPVNYQRLEAAGVALGDWGEKEKYIPYRSENPSLSLHYSPTGKNLIVRTSQKTDCFSARSLDELLAKACEDFPKSS
jgi:hypothetical protein